jgi:hypothetical protein
MVSSGDEGGHYIGPEHALLLEPRQDIIAWMSMGSHVLKEIQNHLPGWAVAQPLQLRYTGLPPLDTGPASDVWICPAQWGKRKDKTLLREAVEASGQGLRPSTGANLQDFMASHGYGFTATVFGLKDSLLHILQYISDAFDDMYTDAMRLEFVVHLQHWALMVHLVAQEGVAAFHHWRDHMMKAFHVAPVLAGYFRARPGTGRTCISRGPVGSEDRDAAQEFIDCDGLGSG